MTTNSKVDRLREALTWAVGFIRCNMPKTAAEYPDMRNAEALADRAPLISGEFMQALARAELAERELSRHTVGAGEAEQCRHMARAAVAALGLDFDNTSPSDITTAVAEMRATAKYAAEVMRMQEQREAELFHLSAEAFRPMWDEARRRLIAVAGEPQNTVSVRRTGNVHSMSASEFEVTYPDGTVGTLWSPPWHELTDDEEQAECLAVAERLFREGRHQKKGRVGTADASTT